MIVRTKGLRSVFSAKKIAERAVPFAKTFKESLDPFFGWFHNMGIIHSERYEKTIILIMVSQLETAADSPIKRAIRAAAVAVAARDRDGLTQTRFTIMNDNEIRIIRDNMANSFNSEINRQEMAIGGGNHDLILASGGL